MRSWFVLITAFVTACGAEDPALDGGPAVVRDSAGIHIVENSRPSLERNTWRLSTEPIVTIGAVDSGEDSQLFNVRDAVRLDNGSIVIANAGSFQLKYFDANGRFIVNAGGQGGGPGEFSGPRRPSSIWRFSSEAVAAWDFSQTRIVIFDTSGQFVEFHSVTREPGAFPEPIGALGDGRMVAYINGIVGDDRSDASVGTVYRDSLRFLWYAINGSDWGEIGWLPGFERQTHDFGGRRSWGRNPFGNPPVFAVGGSSFYYGSADRYEIARFLPNGTLQGLVRRTENDRAMSPEIIAAYADDQMKTAPEDPNLRREWRRAFEESRYPDRFPAYRRIQVDRAHNLWVQGYTLPGDSENIWSTFNPDGGWLTDVTTPLDLSVYEIGDDYVLGMWRDADDVEHVLMYTLIKP